MARSVRDAALETRTARTRLKPSGKPYYRAIEQGLHLGYRKGVNGGKWVMRWYVGDQAYQTDTIATADDRIDPDGQTILTFAQAQAVARERFVQIMRLSQGLPAHAAPFTVGACLEEYLRWLEQNRKTARDARWRAEALISPRLGNVECSKLTTHALRAWRDAIAKEPARLRTKPGRVQAYRVDAESTKDEAKRQRQASANRVLTILKAALNHAWREHKIPSDEAWRALRPFKGADAARLRYLSIEEAKRLIASSSADFKFLVQAALLTGARFGELAALTAPDFNADSGTLLIRFSKSGKGRHVALTEEGIAFFASRCAGRSINDYLLPKADGGRWHKSHQSRPMRAACMAAEIRPGVGFHTLRHTYASLAIMNGTPLMVIARNLGHADTRMVEKHYGHLAPSYVAEAIRAAAPRFGIKS